MRSPGALNRLTKNDLFAFVTTLNKKGGPDTHEYHSLDECINSIPAMLTKEVINLDDIENIKNQCDFLKTDTTVLGHAKLKPFGYPGDYLIIDKIYQKKVSEKYSNWDQYAMNTAAVGAVRNRKEFFKTLIREKLREHKTVHLLNIASGPARDLKEIYDEIDPKRLQTTCVEMDVNAINYAKNLCSNYLSQIEFINQNIFKFSSKEKFDLIWSAGLFDYFNDKIFIQFTKRLQSYLNQNGEMVIGNFSRSNPHRNYMEIFGEWFLNHRNANELLELAIRAGVDKGKATVDQEPLGVNLFLRVNNQTADALHRQGINSFPPRVS